MRALVQVTATLAALVLAAAWPGPAVAQTVDSLVEQLVELTAVSGFEDAIVDRLLAAVPGSVLDRAGNVVWSRGKGDPVRVALCPMDEIGYVVSAVTDDGYLRLRRVGATPGAASQDRFLEGQRVTVFGGRGAVPGVVGVRSLHLARGRGVAAERAFELDDAYVDVGASSAGAVEELGIAALSPVARARSAHRYGAGLIAAPNASARAACAALAAAVPRVRSASGRGTLVAAFTRLRHFGRDGAASLLMERAPRSAAADIVLLGGQAPDDSLGAGATPAERDSLPIGDAVRAVAAWSLPTRYAGTPVETVSLRDVTVLADRLSRFLEGP